MVSGVSPSNRHLTNKSWMSFGRIGSKKSRTLSSLQVRNSCIDGSISFVEDEEAAEYLADIAGSRFSGGSSELEVNCGDAGCRMVKRQFYLDEATL